MNMNAMLLSYIQCNYNLHIINLYVICICNSVMYTFPLKILSHDMEQAVHQLQYADKFYPQDP